MSSTNSENPESLLAQIVDEFTEKCHAGQQPEVEDYLKKYSELADVLEQILPAIAALAVAKPEKRLSDSDPTEETIDAPQTVNPLVSNESARIYHYELLSELGKGGMGIVYKALHTQLKRTVALKMIKAGAGAEQAQLDRFRAEARAVAQINHPNIVQIFEVGEYDGMPFIALEYVEGGNLGNYTKGEPQSAEESARIVEKLALAIHDAHLRGLVHRDLKPANILMSPGGIPKITDFGLVKQMNDDSGQTQSGAIVGTPSFMAPEQASGETEKTSPLIDVYALGAILYDLLTGRPPFKGTSVVETLDQVRNKEAVAVRQLQPSCPRDLETICLKCLEKEPARRYQSAEALAEDLRRYLDHRPIKARPVSNGEKFAKLCRRNPVTTGLVAVTILALLIGGGTAIWQSENARIAAQEKLQIEQAKLKIEKQNSNNLVKIGRQKEENLRLAGEKLKEEQRKLVAEKKAREADQLALAALEKRDASDYSLFINAAQNEIESGNLIAAKGFLERCPEKLRHFEWYHLKHQVSREGVLLQHPGSPNLLKFTSNGQRVITLHTPFGPKGTPSLKVWNVDTLSLEKSWNISDQGLSKAILSKDESLLATNNGVYDFETGKQLLRVQGCRDMVITPDNAYYVGLLQVNAKSSQLQYWEIETEKKVKSVQIPFHTIGTFSPDGKQYAFIVHQKPEQIHFLDLEKGEQKTLPLPDLAWIRSNSQLEMRFLGDGRQLGIWKHGLAVLCNLSNEKRWIQYPLKNAGHNLVLHPNLSLFSSVSKTSLNLMNLSSGNQVLEIRFPQTFFQYIAWEPRRNLIATSDHRGCMIWNLQTQPAIRSIQIRNSDPQDPNSPYVYQGSDPKGKHIVTLRRITDGKTNSYLADLITGELKLKNFTGFRGWRSSSDGSRLAYNQIKQKGPNFVRNLVVHDLKTGDVLREFKDEFPDLPFSCFSDDGTKLLIAKADKVSAEKYEIKIKLIDVDSGKELFHQSRLTNSDYLSFFRESLAISPSGKYICIPSFPKEDANILNSQQLFSIYDVGSGKIVFQTEEVYAKTPFRLRGDEKQVAAVVAEKNDNSTSNLVIWEIETGKKLIERPISPAHALLYSPNGEMLACWSGEKVLVLDGATGKIKQKFDGELIRNNKMLFSFDNKYIAIHHRNYKTRRSQITVWNVNTGKLAYSLPEQESSGMQFGFIPDSNLLYSRERPQDSKTSSKTLIHCLWDAKSGKLIKKIKGIIGEGTDYRNLFRIVPFEKQLEVKLWHADSGQQKFDISMPEQSPVIDVGYHPSGKVIAIGTTTTKGVIVRCLATASGKIVATHEGELPPDGYYPHLDFHLGGKYLAVGGGSTKFRRSWGAVHVWNLETGKKQLLQGHSEPVFDVIFHPDGERVYSWSEDRSVIEWDLSNGTQLNVIQWPKTDRSSRLRLSSTGKYLTIDPITSPSPLSIWSTTESKFVKLEMYEGRYCNGCCFSADGRWFAASVLGDETTSNSLIVWDLETRVRIREIRVGELDPRSLCFSSDNRRIYGGCKGSIVIWDVHGGENRPLLKLQGDPNSYATFQLQEDERGLIYFGQTTAQIFNAAR